MGLFGWFLRSITESPDERIERRQRKIDEWDRIECEEALEEEAFAEEEAEAYLGAVTRSPRTDLVRSFHFSFYF